MIEEYVPGWSIIFKPLVSTVQIYSEKKGQSYAGKTPYTTSMLITDLGLGDCRISLANGELNPDINRGVYRLAKKLGYRRATLEVPEGTTATRMGKYVCTRDGLDRYTVDIV